MLFFIVNVELNLLIVSEIETRKRVACIISYKFERKGAAGNILEASTVSLEN